MLDDTIWNGRRLRPRGRGNRFAGVHSVGRTAAWIVAALVLAGGCSQLIDPNVPEPIHAYRDPDVGREYFLYRPSNYDRRQSWPLVVLCHGGFPDSPIRQLHEWTELAEMRGFLVAAPSLTIPRRRLLGGTDMTRTGQKDNERQIVSVVQHIRAGHTVSRDRVFIHGFAAGAVAALRTGIANPAIFRAISVVKPRVRADDFSGRTTVDPYQPILIRYGISDAVTGRRGDECVRWLRSVGADVRPSRHGKAAGSDAEFTVLAYEDLLRHEPLLRVVVAPDGSENPLRVRFQLVSSVDIDSYVWQFGDGDTARVAVPTHSYAAPGRYPLSVTVRDRSGQINRRAVRVSIPELLITPASLPSDRSERDG